jgi:tRNA-splicing ligase RtcB
MKVISTENNPIKLWSEDIEEGALKQLRNIANLPFLYKWVCAMPDCHQGYGMPIGGVLAVKDVIIPNAVGVDIGCGMLAVKTSLTEISTERLKEVMTLIRKYIPVGFNHHSKNQDEGIAIMPSITNSNLDIVEEEYNNAIKQIGTLGGGNHFIEIQKGSDGYIWFMIHSGSRNLGFKVANYYNKIAIDLNKKWYSNVPSNYELAFLPFGTKEYDNYLSEMNYCVEFALANRRLMAERIKFAFTQTPCFECNGAGGYKGNKCVTCAGTGLYINTYDIKFDEEINISHNYAAMENHYGENVMVHRKGATLAREGTMGLIPGSQGTKSYVVRGKGNSESFMSCSHGAGRKMSRTKAQKELNLEQEIKNMEDKGILHSIRNTNDLDEAPGSYKDISVVMENQKDLVDILIELSPLGVIKG